MELGFEVRYNGSDVITNFDTDTNNSVPFNNDCYVVNEVLTISDASAFLDKRAKLGWVT